MTIYIFIDGNCRNNGKQNATAAYGVYFDDPELSYLSQVQPLEIDQSHTNQKAELSAMILCFGIILNNIETFSEKQIKICSDSMYTIKCTTEWSIKWKQNNWKGSSGKTIQNLELVKHLVSLHDTLAEHDIELSFKHVPSHCKPPQDKSGLTYKLWHGNDVIDNMINQILMKK